MLKHFKKALAIFLKIPLPPAPFKTFSPSKVARNNSRSYFLSLSSFAILIFVVMRELLISFIKMKDALRAVSPSTLPIDVMMNIPTFLLFSILMSMIVTIAC